MKVLVTAASKHSATLEIAVVIGETLERAGIEATVVPATKVATLEGYDAVVLGSAVYAGHWLPAAKDLVEAHRAELRARPVWLFSSGPVGDPLKPDVDPVDAAPIIEATGAREHRLFGGQLDKGMLGFGERALVAALRAPEGDFRPWSEIRAWAGEIATVLRSEALVGAPR